MAECLIDRERGSWHRELDPTNPPSSAVRPGKPDLYHAFQATLLPRLPQAPGLAVAVRDGLACLREPVQSQLRNAVAVRLLQERGR